MSVLEHPFKADCLMVIIPDHLSDLIKKGEVTSRYYNPGDLFKEVHLVLINDDQPDPAAVQKMVGSGKLYLYNLPVGRSLFYRSLGWRPWLLNGWSAPAVALARKILPSLIRCHGNHLNAYLASCIKKELNIPYVVSLHGNPDIDGYRGRLGTTWKKKLNGYAIEAVEIAAIKDADHLLPVYSPIVPYLERYHITKYTLVYNVIGYNCIKKSHYDIDKRNVKCLCIGRQQSSQKDPSSIIEAVIAMQNASLLLVGDGDLHESLVKRVLEANASERIRFIKSMPNSELLDQMNKFDIYIYSSVNFELSKTCIEAALTGMPVILNDRNGEPARELIGDHFLLVEGTKESYQKALMRLIQDDQYREQLGNRAYAHAQKHWAPAKMEAKVVEIYKSVMAEQVNLR